MGHYGALWNPTPDHSSQSAAFTASNYATFSRIAGTVPINVTIDAGGVTSNGVEFDSTGYVIGGPGVLTLGQPSGTIINTVKVLNAKDTATISAQISGTAGLAKTGSGTLILGSSANNFTGGVTISAARCKSHRKRISATAATILCLTAVRLSSLLRATFHSMQHMCSAVSEVPLTLGRAIC